MSEEFFLDDAQVKEPKNIRGFYLKRDTSERFNGSIYDELGTVNDIGGIVFDDPDAVALITGLQDTHLTEARAKFKCLRYGNELFSSEIDFSSVSVSRKNVVEASLKDADANVFIQNIDKPYALYLTDTRTFSSETVYTDYALGLDSEKLQILVSSVPDNATYNPVFKADSKATLLGSIIGTEDYKNRAFYKNSTGQTLVLNMSLQMIGSITASSSCTVEAKVLIRDSNAIVIYEQLITSVNVATMTTFSIIEQLSLDVAIDANVSFVFVVKDPLSTIQIDMLDTSRIDLSEGDLSNITIPVISVRDALHSLVLLASDSLLELVEISGIPDLYLSPYSSVRGRDGKLNISFGELWDDLNALFCLRITQFQDELQIQSFVDSFTGLSPYLITDVVDYEINTDFQHLYNSASVGFSNWKPKNDAGVPESTGPLTLSTALVSAPSELDLTVKSLIGSLKILSETYLMRNRPGTENENEGMDQRAFLLSANNEIKISSLTSLEHWYPIIGDYHRYLKKETGEGAYMNEEISINLAGKKTIFTPKTILLSCNMPTEDFIYTGDIVRLIDGSREYSVFVSSIQHHPLTLDVESQGNTTITGRLINQINA